MNESQVFAEVLQRATATERAAYLDEACAGNPQLRADVEGLLKAHADNPGFLEQPAGSFPETVGNPESASVLDRPGTDQAGFLLAGRYKFLEPIGEGGMGSVWMAQQTKPVKRLVAVKLIKVGTDSRQVLARFEAERQALALMDHPNIAKVLDAGAASDGRPFFVMELVKGVPITKYCDEHHLPPRQRLELFVPVCHAIQHAHQKGIIHRDIKPSNVLVALYDDKPVPKVIDFGVAKATGQQLTEQTLHTGFGAVVGTLEYMSPEQASFSQLDVDTRSDVYSLGVLPYELLTGSPPFSSKELEKAGVMEMLRVTREQEPSRPSTKFSTAEGLPTLAANRGTEPAKLTKLVRGELDWIVMKAMEKDRSRCYETANGFAMDLQRYLADEPVLACPPSAGYRFRKFALRHKAGLVLTSVLVLALLTVVGTVAGSIGWVARDKQARQSAVAEEVERALHESARQQGEGKLPEALSAAQRAHGLLTGGADEALRERVHARVADLELVAAVEDIRLRKSEVTIHQVDHLGSDGDYAAAFQKFGLSEELTEVAERIRSTSVPLELVAALDDWVMVRRWAHADEDKTRRLLAVARAVDPDPWRCRLRDLLEGRPGTDLKQMAASAPVDTLPPITLAGLGSLLLHSAAAEQAAVLLLKAQRQHPADFWINTELARALGRTKPPRPDEAIRFHSVALALRPHSVLAHLNLGVALSNRDRFEEAIAEYKEAIRLKPDFAWAHYNLGGTLAKKGDVDTAIAAYTEAIRIKPDHANARNNLGVELAKKGDLVTASAQLKEVIRLEPKHALAQCNLGNVLKLKGHPCQAGLRRSPL